MADILPARHYWLAVEDDEHDGRWAVYEARQGDADEGDDTEGLIADDLYPAYAHLIAAAPQLLAAAEAAVARCLACHGTGQVGTINQGFGLRPLPCEACKGLRAALAAARGAEE